MCRLLLLAALCIVSAPTAATITVSSIPPDGGTAEEVLTALRSAEPPADDVVLELLATEPGSALALLNALDERTLGRGEDCDDEPCVHLSRAERGQVEQRLDRLPPLAASRRASLGVAEVSAESAIALEILAGRGTANMELVLELGEPHADATAEVFAPVAAAFESATLVALAEDTRSFSTVDKGFTRSHPVLRPILLSALGRTERPESLELLPLLLGRDPELDVQVLTQLITVAREVRKPLDHGRLVRVRSYLTRHDPLLRSQAAQALGRLRDYESVRDLIELLSDEQTGVRTSAHWALRTTTAMTLDPSPLPWLSWYQSQTRWWAEAAPELLQRLDHAGPAELVSLLRELGSKRLFRHPLTERMLPLLRHANPQVILMTCSAIQNLRSANAEAELARLFDHESGDVRRQSRRAWEQITGRTAPVDEVVRPR